jgi:hypothetical protein
MPAVALYLQFKRADCMMRRSAKELNVYNLPLFRPFYRFKIAESGKSDQHELLLALDDGSCFVFYAAPRFHEISEINDAWRENLVATRSIFVAPRVIGPLDTDSHHVAYDEREAWLCSDPKRLDFLDSNNLIEQLLEKLHADSRPLREKIPEFVHQIDDAEQQAMARIAEKGPDQVRIPRAIPLGPTIPSRGPRTLTEPERQLRQISDAAARVFDAQLIIVQPPDR